MDVGKTGKGRAKARSVPANQLLKDEIAQFTRRRILETARDQFFHNGYQGTTLDSIAAALGVTKPVLYAHFRSKDQILEEVSRIGTEQILQAAQLSLAGAGSARDRLEFAVGSFVRSVISYQKNIALFFREEKSLSEQSRKYIYDMQQEFDDVLANIIEDGVKSGLFSVADVRMSVLAIGGMISWIYLWYRTEGRLDADTIVASFTSYALRLVGCG